MQMSRREFGTTVAGGAASLGGGAAGAQGRMPAGEARALYARSIKALERRHREG